MDDPVCVGMQGAEGYLLFQVRLGYQESVRCGKSGGKPGGGEICMKVEVNNLWATLFLRGHAYRSECPHHG
eukprot:366450-Chlamydomonas_euryale.AAC.32